MKLSLAQLVVELELKPSFYDTQSSVFYVIPCHWKNLIKCMQHKLLYVNNFPNSKTTEKYSLSSYHVYSMGSRPKVMVIIETICCTFQVFTVCLPSF